MSKAETDSRPCGATLDPQPGQDLSTFCEAYSEENGEHCRDCLVYKHQPNCSCTNFYRLCPEYEGGTTSIMGRWADHGPTIITNPDGTKKYVGFASEEEGKRVEARLEAIAAAEEHFDLTGDDSRLKELGQA